MGLQIIGKGIKFDSHSFPRCNLTYLVQLNHRSATELLHPSIHSIVQNAKISHCTHPPHHFFPTSAFADARKGRPLIFAISNHTRALTKSASPYSAILFGSNFIIRFGAAVRGRTNV
jgi:hypothetical protein